MYAIMVFLTERCILVSLDTPFRRGLKHGGKIMLIAVDVGNTLTDIGFYDGDDLRFVFKTKSDPSRSYDECQASLELFLRSRELDPKEVDGAILCSVVPSLEKIWSKLLLTVFEVRPLLVGPKLKTGLPIKTDNPKEVGADLIADAVGAKKKYGSNVIIADLGTATKLILLNSKGEFEGCCIGIGLSIGLDALVKRTAALPEVNLNVPKHVIGKNTSDSMNSALTYGTAAQIQGLAKMIEKEAGVPCKRILTGGYSHFIASLLPDWEYDENLLFIGLKDIFDRNRKQ